MLARPAWELINYLTEGKQMVYYRDGQIVSRKGRTDKYTNRRGT